MFDCEEGHKNVLTRSMIGIGFRRGLDSVLTLVKCVGVDLDSILTQIGLHLIGKGCGKRIQEGFGLNFYTNWTPFEWKRIWIKESERIWTSFYLDKGR